MQLESKVSDLYNSIAGTAAKLVLAASVVAYTSGCIHTAAFTSVGAPIGSIEMYKSAPKKNTLAQIFAIPGGFIAGGVNGLIKGLPRDFELWTAGKINFYGIMDPFGPDNHNQGRGHLFEEYMDGYTEGDSSTGYDAEEPGFLSEEPGYEE